MKKIYEKPEIENVTLTAQEALTADTWVDGEAGVESNSWFT